jgi:hypothetical protein
MRPLIKRADVAIARARRLRGDWPDDGNCHWCGESGWHVDGCLNVTHPSNDGSRRPRYLR